MFITLANLDTSKPVTLPYGIDNRDGNKVVAIHEMFYTVKWSNIKDDSYYVRVGVGNSINDLSSEGKHIISPGYYDFCTLANWFQSEFKIKATLNPANFIVTLEFPSQHTAELAFSENLAKLLGLKGPAVGPHLVGVGLGGKTKTGDYPANLSVHKVLNVHLNELNTYENVHNGFTSTLLRCLPVGSAAYCETVVVRFPKLQFKTLGASFFDSLSLYVTNQDGKHVQMDDFCVVLEVK
jgi:hypothetical protein